MYGTDIQTDEGTVRILHEPTEPPSPEEILRLLQPGQAPERHVPEDPMPAEEPPISSASPAEEPDTGAELPAPVISEGEPPLAPGAPLSSAAPAQEPTTGGVPAESPVGEGEPPMELIQVEEGDRAVQVWVPKGFMGFEPVHADEIRAFLDRPEPAPRAPAPAPLPLPPLTEKEFKTLRDAMISNEPIPIALSKVVWAQVFHTGNDTIKIEDFVRDVEKYRGTADPKITDLQHSVIDRVFTGQSGFNIENLKQVIVDAALHESEGYRFRYQRLPSGKKGAGRGLHSVELDTARDLLKQVRELGDRALIGPKARAIIEEEGFSLADLAKKEVPDQEISDALEGSDAISTIFATAHLIRQLQTKKFAALKTQLRG